MLIVLPNVQLHLQQKTTTIDWIRYNNSTPTKYATSLMKRMMVSFQTPVVTEENVPLTSLFHLSD